MHLQHLRLHNYRGFEHLDLDFHERLTVLVGVNGSGKSSILDALRVLLAGALHRALRVAYPVLALQVQPEHVHDRAEEAALALRARAERRDWEYEEDWTQSTIVPGQFELQWTTTLEASHVLDPGEWLVMSYGVGRALLDRGHNEAPESKELLSMKSAFLGSLTAHGSFLTFLRWFRAREDVENEQRLRGDPALRDPQLQAVRRAITSMMPGYDELFVQRQPGERLMLSKQGQKLSINQLSDGEKCLLAMVGDIARRMAMVARQEQDPLATEAVVMIDEIELHLHPGWQREVVPRLLATFPRCQFVLTTHSPQVLSSVGQESLFVLEDFKLRPAVSPTRGRDSTSILVDVMGVPEHPPETAARLHHIAELLDEDQLEPARTAIEDLARELGEHDQQVVRFRSLLGFLGG